MSKKKHVGKKGKEKINQIMFFQKEKVFSKEWFKNYYLTIQGALLAAMGYTFFLIPHKIVPGGLFGIGVIFYHLTKIPTGLTVLVLNIPLLIWGIKVLGPRFGAKTIIGTVTLSVITDIMTFFTNSRALTDDVLVAAIIGGGLTGAGISLIFRAKATTGGMDILSQILYHKYKQSIGITLMVSNFAIIGCGVLAFKDINIAIYAGISTFVSSKIIDVVLEGYSYYKGIFIVSEKYLEIKNRILYDLKRGGTILLGKGMFLEKDKRIIFSALNRREIAILKDYVSRIDPQAFVFVFNTQEVYGKGFQWVNEK